MHHRFRFRFWNRSLSRGEEVVLIGLHYEDAKTGAWSVLADRTGERDPRRSWRLVSTEQAPLRLEVAS